MSHGYVNLPQGMNVFNSIVKMTSVIQLAYMPY